MSVSAREFVFCVDTEEVATSMSPPAPVIAQPKRRPAAPTVALRLPNLLAEPASVPAPTAAPTFCPWVAPEMNFSMPPKPEAIDLPAPTATIPLLPPTVSPATLAVVEEPAPRAIEPIIAEQQAVATQPAESPQIASEQEPLWKNPKFMLAGVAATFLGMVSLIAMKHEPSKPTEDAPAWQGASTAQAESTEAAAQTPIVVRGGAAPEETWAVPAFPESTANQEQPTGPSATRIAPPTTLFADRSAAYAEPYTPPAQHGWADDTTAPPAEDDMETGVRLMPNLSTGAYEASRTENGYTIPTRQ